MNGGFHVDLQSGCALVDLSGSGKRSLDLSQVNRPFLELNLGQLQTLDLNECLGKKAQNQTTTPLPSFFFFLLLLSMFLRTEIMKAFGLRFCTVKPLERDRAGSQCQCFWG